jgi:hypothetical protein
MPNPKHPTQRRLFELISASYKRQNLSWLKQYSLELNLSKTSAYNHARGHTGISFDAGAALMHRHQLDIPVLFPYHADSALEPLKITSAPADDVSDFLEQLMSLLRENSDVTQIQHFCEDQPIFWLKHIRILALFKLYFWKRFLCNDPEWRIPFTEKLEVTEPFHSYLSQSRQLRDMFMALPRTECWSVGIYDKLIEQILYTRDVGAFASTHMATHLLEQVNALVSRMETQAQDGQTQIYANELFSTGNFLFVNNQQVSYLVLLQEWPTFITLQPTVEVALLKQKAMLLIERMQPIGAGAERERRRFFDHMRHRVELRFKRQ